MRENVRDRQSVPDNGSLDRGRIALRRVVEDLCLERYYALQTEV